MCGFAPRFAGALRRQLRTFDLTQALVPRAKRDEIQSPNVTPSFHCQLFRRSLTSGRGR
jgi:hypothetical protein